MEYRLKKLFGDTFLFTISSFGSKILVFLMLPLYTSVLTLEEYSTADIIANTVALLIPVLTLSICDATLRFALGKNTNIQSVLSNSLLLVSSAMCILLVATPFVKIFAESLFYYWWYLFATFVVTALQQCLSNYIKGINKTKIFAVQGILFTLVLVACNLLFLLVFKWRLEGYLLAIIIANASSIIFMCISAKLWRRLFVLKIDRALLKEMLMYSMPMLLTTIAWWANTSLDKYMLLGLVGLSANGLYAVAHKVPSIFTTVTTLFSQAWRISAISDYEEGDIQSTAKFYSLIHRKYTLFCVYACAAIVLFSQLLAKFLFQSEYYVAWSLIPPLMLASLFEAFSGFLASIYAALKKTKFLSISTGIGMIINIILNYFLVKKMGIIGAPIATFLSFIFVWGIRLIILKRLLPLNVNFKTLVPTLLILTCGSLYYSFDCPYKTLLFVFCICAIILVNIKETKNTIVSVFNLILKNK